MTTQLRQSIPKRRRTRNYDVGNIGLLIDYLEEYLVPVGTIVSKITDITPGDAWVKIAGQSLSKSDFPQLYAELGGKFGEDESTFNLPDLSGAYLTGVDANAGGFVGANDVALTVDQIPAHNHQITDPGHSHTATSPPHSHAVTDPGHTHTITDPGHAHTSGEVSSAAGTTGGDDGVASGSTGSSTTGITVDSSQTGVTVDDATATVSVQSAQTGVSVNQSGGGQAFDNRPRSIEVYYFIKAKT